MICKKSWLYRKRIRVLAGKLVTVTSGGVLHTAAVMGYINEQQTRDDKNDEE